MFGVKVITFCAIFSMVNSSAIPMWEYLTQDEKVMYLFNMFQLQVQDVCKTDECKQELKNYGWKKLKSMSVDDLDEMDPFQRNSNDILWDSVMKGHSLAKTTPKPTITTKSNSFDDYLELDTNVEASARIETVSKVLPPKGFNYNQPQTENNQKHKQDGFNFGTYSNKIQESTTDNIPIYESYGEYQRVPLQGPWVVKVHPDGSPVKDSSETVPEDDDLRLYQMTKVIQTL